MNPLLGVLYHWLGGLASGSFYVPFRGVKRWSWETSWLVAGVFSWIVAPWFFAFLNTSDVLTVLKETPRDVWFYTYLFGVLWGTGGLTFGLTMRYLGMSLGMAVALGYCTVFGTLIPPIFKGEFHAKLIEPVSGRWVLAGLGVCVIGIIITALAGRAKENSMTEEQKRATVKEFNFKKGIIVATFSGIMSACFAFGLTAGDKVREITYKVDLQKSAAAQGKTIERPADPTASEEKEFLAQPAVVALFPGTTPTVAGVLGKIEEPYTLRESISELKAKNLPEKQAEIASKEGKLPAAEEASLTARTSVTGSDAVSRRVAAYATGIAALSDTGALAVVDGLAALSEKETALNVATSGLDLKAMHAKHVLWTGLPVLIIVLLGGFTTNFLWCVGLNIRNRTGYEYFATRLRHASHGKDASVIENVTDAPAVEMAEQAGAVKDTTSPRVPILGNYLFAALAGVTWYFQFFFYSMGETQMGEYKFSSWTLHMASIIIFSSLWGIALLEWKGANAKSKRLLGLGLLTLILCTMLIGYGNLIGGSGGH